MAANGAAVASLGSPTTNNNLLSAEVAQIGLATGTQTATTGILRVAVQPFIALTGTTPPASAQNQPGQPGNGIPFSFTSTNFVLPGGALSPGVPTGFTGRIVFANTGTPERVANGTGDFSPAAGVVPTGLYLNGGGGDNAPQVQPARPAPPPPLLPPPGVFSLPIPEVVGLDADPGATPADVALSTFLEAD
jgi:hypothetical protein